MNVDDGAGLVSPEAIRSHPRFPQAREAYIDAALAMYEGNYAATELMLDAGRIMIFGIIMCLWGAYDEAQPDTWPTVNKLKESLSLFGVVGSRQIDNILSRLSHVGYVRFVEAPKDARLRIVLPTPQMIEHDRDWLRVHYLPHACLFGASAYALPLARDPVFQREQHAAAVATFAAAADNVVQKNLPILQFLNRSAGLLILMKLIQMTQGLPDNPLTLSFTELGRQFGVSRTHVRDLIAASVREGHIVSEKANRIRLTSSLLSAFDLHLSNGMALLDFSHSAATAKMAKAREP